MGHGGNRPPPPFVNWHSLSEIFDSVGIQFKTIEYTEVNKSNYWRRRPLICIELRFDYLEARCLI